MIPVHILLAAALLGAAACAPAGRLFDRGPNHDPNVEQQYHRALSLLDDAPTLAELDSATHLLDAYLAHRGETERRAEAVVLRRLAGDAMQLARVSAALQAERASTETRSKADSTPPKSDTDSLKEIQRLKDELAAANAELERIRKRLATQKP